MRVSIYGCGYVGLVTAASLASMGIDVGIYDIDEERMSHLERMKQLIETSSPINEPGLGELLRAGFLSGKLKSFPDITDIVHFGDIHIIAVGTPIKNGDLDLSYVMKVADDIAHRIYKDGVIINKSTSPVGTLEKIKDRFRFLPEQTFKIGFVSNPEFLTEGIALENFKNPDRIVIGADDDFSRDMVLDMYQEAGLEDRVITMESKSAEFTKYAANAMLATRISFINEMAELAKLLSVDINEVIEGIGSDKRIGSRYLSPGCGYGGSCLPKDIKALITLGDRVGTNMALMSAVDRVNERQKVQMFREIETSYSYLSDKPGIRGRTFGFWGLSYKEGTDDVRESPALILIDELLKAGVHIIAYDAAAGEKVKQIYGDKIKIVDSLEKVLTNSDGLVIMTESKEFKEYDMNVVQKQLRHSFVFDGRNLFDPERMQEIGIFYHSFRRLHWKL